ncbi:Myb-like DNA-binding domain protein [Aspergillus candidus]|uniref:Myb-like DNA-binding domain protein n=1 Tax=Aspergillus candidus TaxID=41067 RepID=A0A2I2F187_ASPCN|nr:hypothetical protein BDW47DRAFT_78552 [Aspergillus candidus]PLB34395.1 hypothetical protein BDW47DRAFT_78552 [Aspergillus candidus]
MDLPPKRPHLSFTELTNDYDDDDDNETSETNQQDPDESHQVNLQEARFHNDQRLKSIFEGIFEKYEKDFTDVGDEIDLESGSILVNNGHIATMDGEGDTGERGFWLFDQEELGEEGRVEGEDYDDDDDGSAGVFEVPDTLEGETGGDGDLAIGEDEGIRPPHLPYTDRSYNLDGQSERPEDKETHDVDSEVEDNHGDQESVHFFLDEQGKNNRGGDAAYPPAAGKGNNSSTETPLPPQSAPARTTATATDPKWHFPEISRRLWTPPAHKPRPPPTPINTIRSASPPGSGSLWALPGKRRNAGSTKKKPSTMASQRKRKRHSSPVVCDWSFAKTPDGSESDDPLQEDYEPSPTPRKGVPIRGKRRRVEDLVGVDDQSLRKEESRGEDQEHVDTAQSQSQSPGDGDRDSSIETPRPVRTASTNTALDSEPIEPSNNDKIHNSTVTGDDSRRSPAAQSPTTPIQRRKITPEEAKLLVTMRQNQGKRWKEIRSHIPDKKEVLLSKWFGSHWTDRLMNPLPLSAPWSKTEQAKLDSLKNQPGLTWDAIRASVPGRPFAEVEFELLRAWVGEDGRDGTQ